MAAPNIVNVTSIFGFTTTIALTTTAGAVLLANASSSGKVFKICLTSVVLPEPEGAENMISLPFSMCKYKTNRSNS